MAREQQPDEGPYDEVPRNLRTILNTVGIISTEGIEGEIAEMLTPAREGRCMTCQAKLGPSTILLVNSSGVGATYCGGACMQDMAVLGWLQEEHDDIVDKVNFRGGKGEGSSTSTT